MKKRTSSEVLTDILKSVKGSEISRISCINASRISCIKTDAVKGANFSNLEKISEAFDTITAHHITLNNELKSIIKKGREAQMVINSQKETLSNI